MNWTDNEREDLETATILISEFAQEILADLTLGVIVAGCGAFYLPAVVLGHVRRGLRDFRSELKKWKEPTDG
ncbi:hypothetical protein LCGC14_0259220 [marine sediment metagenome]|uniref:Uncharacterized protein n=1 Tax=marine sediment metagenome TaxID=412755 RepID=A0A0F9UJC8_9ZZZZ